MFLRRSGRAVHISASGLVLLSLLCGGAGGVRSGTASLRHQVPVRRHATENVTARALVHNASAATVPEAQDKSWSGCRLIAKKNWPGPRSGSALHFIHIPRTAGTTIESCSKFFPQGYAPWGTMNPEIQGMKAIRGRSEKCYGQHVPPAMFPAADGPYMPKKNNFCVVRHPYDRLISQFGWANSFSAASKYHCTPASMNKYLLEQLRLVASGRLFLGDCHFTPESLFVFGYNAKTYRARRDQRWCTHVVRFEHLSEDFNRLMTKFGYAVELGTWGAAAVDDGLDDRHMASADACRALKASQLSPEVKALAYEIYRDDFDAFGYSP